MDRVSFATTTITAGYLLYRCLIPPNPLRIETAKDSPGSRLMTPAFTALSIYRSTLLASSLLTGAVALHGPPYEQALITSNNTLARYVHAGQTDLTLLTWNRVSATVLAAITVGQALRLHVMKALGKSFTFDLHEPEGLVTSGVYKYMQHPSYAFGFLAFVPANTWLIRVDGPLGPLLPSWLFQFLIRWQPSWHLFAACCIILGIAIRIRDEEAMLKAEFGKEWAEWHGKTARFIPFVL